ncbi:MAG: 50S ribosomal protein L13 [bacterium]|nr:50S ribosomal protein L13 [bacterium]
MDYIIDAKNQRLGRLATQIAVTLQGKKNVKYEPRLRGEDRVVVKNAGGIVVTGGKEKKKIYYRHTGYMGHLREHLFAEEFAKHPGEVLREAVRRMLPRNFLRDKRLAMLKIEK